MSELSKHDLVQRLDEPDLTYIFKHALTQDAAYQALLLKRRRELHRVVAETYERLFADQVNDYAALLARHFSAAEDWPRAADYALRAGGSAMHSYALVEALEYYEQALGALEKIPAPPPEQVIDVTLAWIRPASHLRPYGELLARLDRVQEIARNGQDKRRLSQILHWIVDVHFANGYNSRAFPALFENYQLALEFGDERSTVVPSYWMAFIMVDRDPAGALAELENVILLAHKYQNVEIEAHAIASQAYAHARLGEFDRAQAEIRHALELVQQVNSPIKQADVSNLAGFTYLDMGDLDRALEFAERGAEKALKAQVPECASAGLIGVGFCRLQAQDMPKARQAFEQSMRLAESADSDHLRVQALAGLAVAQFYGGEPRAVQEMETILVQAQSIDSQYASAFLSLMLGEVYAEQGAWEKSAQYLESALTYYRQTGLRPYLRRPLQSIAQVYEQQGRAADAQAVRDEAQSLIKEFG
ncbi:MAG: hypothetical protein WCF84_19185 [Anaerolineae bacterium]